MRPTTWMETVSMDSKMHYFLSCISSLPVCFFVETSLAQNYLSPPFYFFVSCCLVTQSFDIFEMLVCEADFKLPHKSIGSVVQFLTSLVLSLSLPQCRPPGTQRRTATELPPSTAPSCPQHPGRPVNPTSTVRSCPAARPTQPSWETCPMMSLRSPSKSSSAAWQ